MKLFTALSSLKEIIRNTKQLFGLATAMDNRTTTLYFLTAGIGALVPLAASYVLKLLIDHLQTTQQSLLPTIPIIIIVVLATRYVITLVESVVYYGLNQSYLDYIFRYKLQNEITNQFHEKIQKLDIAYFEKPDVQDLITKTRDTMQWRVPDQFRMLAYVFNDAVAFAAAFIVLLPFGWWIPLLVSAIALPRLYLQGKYGALHWSLWGSGAPQAKKLWYLNFMLQEPMTVRELRIARSSRALLDKFCDIQDDLFKLHKVALDRYLKVLTIPPIIEAVIVFIIAYTFLPAVTTAALSIGSFALLITMLEQLGSRAASASAHSAQMYENNLYVNHFFEFINLPPLIVAAAHPVTLELDKPPKIEFRNVTFHYPDGPKVLDNVSFTIESGQSVALVGHNGAGKTTIIKLLCRFYDVSDGEILINDINIKDVELASWYQYMGTLFQEFVKYHFTVRENIILGAPDKKDESLLKEAAHKSGAAEFIEKLPQQYNQMLGKEFEDGEELSGGQWQKLAIARAFYQDPPVLILDEPTSAIDAEAEYEIFNNLEKQYKNKTLILVSHRFSTVRNANKIIVIEEGKVVETGTHTELVALGKQYAKLFLIQARGYR